MKHIFVEKLSIALLLLLLPECATHQAMQVPEVGSPSTGFVNAGVVSSGQAFVEQGAWWESFRNQHLNTMMDSLFAANLQLEQAAARVDQAQALYRVTHAGRLPSVTATGTAQRSRIMTSFGPVTDNNFRLSAAAAYEVDIWGKIRQQDRAAMLRALASEEDMRSLYLTMAAQFVDVYYLSVELQQQLALLDLTIASSRDYLEIVDRRYQQGLVSALDVYQAQQQLANILALRPDVASALQSTQHGLQVLLGRYPTATEQNTDVQLPELQDSLPVGLSSDLITRRPDLRSALNRLQAVDADLAAAVRAQYPSLSLTANGGTTSREFADILDPENRFWTLVANLVQPLFDGGRRQAQAEYQEARRRESLAQYRLALLGAFQEVENALVDEAQLRQRLAYQAEQVAASRNSLRIATDRYLQGLIDFLPVLNAQQGLYQSQRAQITTRRNLVSSRISLARALGGSWEDALVQSNLLHTQ
jgi:NodT family efflux transporter outer membrane factor (OMF) lipoprotein